MLPKILVMSVDVMYSGKKKRRGGGVVEDVNLVFYSLAYDTFRYMSSS